MNRSKWAMWLEPKWGAWAILLVLGIAALALFGETQSQSSRDIGRYQLFQGEVRVTGIGENQKSVLRIDTQTGAVDEWIMGTQKDGSTVDLWVRTGQIQPKGSGAK